MKRNIFKIDNYLITYGVIQIIFLTILLMVWPDWKYNSYTITNQDGSITRRLTNEEKMAELQIQNPGKIVTFSEKSFPTYRLFFLTMGIALLGIGTYYRIFENKVLRVWNAVEIGKEVKIDDLISSLGLPRQFILDALPLINSQNKVYYIYDSRSEKILDGKFRIKFSFSEKCSGCGNMVSKDVTADFSETIKCDYCGTDVAREVLNKYKLEILNKKEEQSEAPPEGMNLAVFITLLILFWPAAIVYAVKTSKKLKKYFTIDELEIMKNLTNYSQRKK